VEKQKPDGFRLWRKLHNCLAQAAPSMTHVMVCEPTRSYSRWCGARSRVACPGALLFLLSAEIVWDTLVFLGNDLGIGPQKPISVVVNVVWQGDGAVGIASGEDGKAHMLQTYGPYYHCRPCHSLTIASAPGRRNVE